MDDDLLMRVQTRDEEALATLYDHYSGLVYTLAFRLIGDRDLAREVLQDTFLHCWHHAAQYDPLRGRVGSWLMGITRNRAIDLLRSRQHQARLREQELLPLADQSPLMGEPDASEQIVLKDSVQAALDRLTVEQRQVIELAYYSDFTQVEIARRLGEPLGTVKTRTRAALERLRKTLQIGIGHEAADTESS